MTRRSSWPGTGRPAMSVVLGCAPAVMCARRTPLIRRTAEGAVGSYSLGLELGPCRGRLVADPVRVPERVQVPHRPVGEKP